MRYRILSVCFTDCSSVCISIENIYRILKFCYTLSKYVCIHNINIYICIYLFVLTCIYVDNNCKSFSQEIIKLIFLYVAIFKYFFLGRKRHQIQISYIYIQKFGYLPSIGSRFRSPQPCQLFSPTLSIFVHLPNGD